MTTTAQTWEERVEQWRASGLTSAQFCQGQPFTAQQLRTWAYRLRKVKASSARPTPVPVRLARVVVAPPAAPVAPAPPEAVAPLVPLPQARGAQEALVLETQGVRIALRPGFDAALLTSVLDVLDRRTSLTKRAS